jgi:predicted GNAT superfamily acetyltransferase
VQESSDPSAPVVGSDGITIRHLASLEDYTEAVALEDETWGAGFSDRVPAAILRVGQKVGGVTAGAFDPDGRMLGFVFGLTGVRDGELVHWSDMLAVRLGARGHHLGERLKHYQREAVRALGVKRMLWTFDPLVARNAHFNLNKLCVGIADYVPNFYGANTGSVLHGSLPTDRFVADWSLDAEAQPHAGDHVDTKTPVTTFADGGRVRTADPLPEADVVRVPVPSDIESVIKRGGDEALAWRLATRNAIMHYLARGYRVSGFRRGTDRELPAYELSSSSTHPA